MLEQAARGYHAVALYSNACMGPVSSFCPAAAFTSDGGNDVRCCDCVRAMTQRKLHKQRELERMLRPEPVQLAAGTRLILARRARSAASIQHAAALSSSVEDAAYMRLAVCEPDVVNLY